MEGGEEEEHDASERCQPNATSALHRCSIVRLSRASTSSSTRLLEEEEVFSFPFAEEGHEDAF